MSQCPWKEYTTDNGKIYYHNVTTKESRWVIPPELEEIKKRIASEDSLGGAPLGTVVPDISSPLPPTTAEPGAASSPAPGGGNSSSALEAAMVATLAAISVPSTPPPKMEQEEGGNTPHADVSPCETHINTIANHFGYSISQVPIIHPIPPPLLRPRGPRELLPPPSILRIKRRRLKHSRNCFGIAKCPPTQVGTSACVSFRMMPDTKHLKSSTRRNNPSTRIKHRNKRTKRKRAD